MGLFSSKKTTYVASQVWNLAGAIEDRPNFLKLTVLGGVLRSPNVGDSVVSSYITGPGIKFRSYDRWAKKKQFESDKPDVVGKVSFKEFMGLKVPGIYSSGSIDPTALLEIVKQYFPEDFKVTITEIDVGMGNMSWHVEKYLLDTYGSDYLDGGYTVIEDPSDTEGNVTIQLTKSGEIITFPEPDVPDFLTNKFLYVRYKVGENVGEVSDETFKFDGEPSLGNYTYVSTEDNSSVRNVPLLETIGNTKTNFTIVIGSYSAPVSDITKHYKIDKRLVGADFDTGKPMEETRYIAHRIHDIYTLGDLYQYKSSSTYSYGFTEGIKSVDIGDVSAKSKGALVEALGNSIIGSPKVAFISKVVYLKHTVSTESINSNNISNVSVSFIQKVNYLKHSLQDSLSGSSISNPNVVMKLIGIKWNTETDSMNSVGISNVAVNFRKVK